MKKNRSGWFFVALGALAVSFLSLFTPVIIYTKGMPPMSFPRILSMALFGGAVSGGADSFYGAYTILDLIGSDRFVREVLVYYNGRVFWRIDTMDVIALALLVIVSLAASLVGICTMRSQYHKKWQFIMALAGLVGTTFPSMIVFYAVSQSQKGFEGVMQCGIAPLIMPVAALISMIAVIYRRSTVQKEIRQRVKAENLIRTAGDLSSSGQSGRYR